MDKQLETLPEFCGRHSLSRTSAAREIREGRLREWRQQRRANPQPAETRATFFELGNIPRRSGEASPGRKHPVQAGGFYRRNAGVVPDSLESRSGAKHYPGKDQAILRCIHS